MDNVVIQRCCYFNNINIVIQGGVGYRAVGDDNANGYMTRGSVNHPTAEYPARGNDSVQSGGNLKAQYQWQ
ncbi:hypothetical protein [Dickeya oryzae]|uniref:Pectate lyase n=1 Tax=Dickeya oryzae TaxID=1240404 RepID=A0AB39IPH3_9GAMM|nr:hypothetical protein [Dickeya oryzae]MBP2848695.1 hypothetical protein [Dickeya oryzae]MCA6990656.1 hypothetical protein [Dickeya oryzae]MCA6993789.1 hypothetical protein [Dickeya oryzae]